MKTIEEIIKQIEFEMEVIKRDDYITLSISTIKQLIDNRLVYEDILESTISNIINYYSYEDLLYFMKEIKKHM